MSKIPQGWLSYDALPVQQGKHVAYFFRAPASDLKTAFSVHLRNETEDEGYQRHFSPSRVRAISKYIKDGNSIPLTVLVSLDRGAFDNGKLWFPSKRQTGWIIDGQHRFLGAVEAGGDFQVPFLAFVKLDEDEQINQFVTINREAKGVPTSLYYDLLPKLRDRRTPTVAAKERAVDLAHALRKDDESCFFGRIVVTTSPARGQLSLNNFVRKVHPLLIHDKGIFGSYAEPQQAQVIDNYFRGLGKVFPKEFGKTNSKFFQTLGFGALINALPSFFSTCLGLKKAFTVEAVSETFKLIDHFDFDAWAGMGSGSQAERTAGEDLVAELTAAVSAMGPDGGTLKLK